MNYNNLMLLVIILVTRLETTMALSFKYSTGTMACLLSKVQEQVNSAVIWLTVNRVPFPGIFQSGKSRGILNRLGKVRENQTGKV